MMDTTEFRRPGLIVREHTIEVPLDHRRPDGRTITVFGRELTATGPGDAASRPWLCFLQGGPGHAADRPGPLGGWLARAVPHFRVLLLDQRGTGRSTPADRQTLAGLTPEAQAEWLTHFRADAIVADAEAFRHELTGGEQWTVLGQSFGGFVICCYLSQAPGGLREALVTAGLPGLGGGPDPVYRLTYAQTARRNREFFARYPGDEDTARRVALHLDGAEELLPTGERLSSRRFRQIGIRLGSAAGFDDLHYVLEDPFVTVGGGLRLRDGFLAAVGRFVSFTADPLYAVLHEAIYAQGAATRWSAARVRGEFAEFALADGDLTDPRAPFYFTGEHVYPWQFDEDPALVPLREAAGLLAKGEDWPALYDRDVLAANTVPVAAAVYVDDMFVPFELSRATAGAVRGARPVITNDYQHDGLRRDPALFDRLLRTVRE